MFFFNGIKLKKYFTWCQNRDKQSRMELTGVQSPQMNWEALPTTRGTHVQWSARCKERGRKVYLCHNHK